MLEHALLQVFGQVIRNDELPFDEPLGSGMSPYTIFSAVLLHTLSVSYGLLLTTEAMPMHVVLGPLNCIDLIRDRLYVLCLIRLDDLHAFCIPSYVLPILKRHCDSNSVAAAFEL